MITINHRSGLVRSAVAAPALVLLLAGCGGSSSTSSGASTTSTAAATPGAGSGAGNRGGMDFAAIQSCLTAAGISLPTPSGTFARPSGGAGGGAPNGAPPSGAAGGGAPNGTPPSGARGGGGFGGQFRSAKVQAALKACGITLPTRGARPSASATTG